MRELQPWTGQFSRQPGTHASSYCLCEEIRRRKTQWATIFEQLGTATLDTMGGLVTNANPEDLPEGASPRCWDVDFIIGSVFTRYGLVSQYVYTTVLNISSVTVGSSLGIFSYTGVAPTVNESFTLSGFIGSAYFLNGQTIYII